MARLIIMRLSIIFVTGSMTMLFLWRKRRLDTIEEERWGKKRVKGKQDNKKGRRGTEVK